MISGIELKKILYQEPRLIKQLLISMGCRHVFMDKYKITSTRPDDDADNKGSVYIRLNELLKAKCYTRPEFENNYEICDIISLTQFFLNLELDEAIKYICTQCGIDGYKEYKKQEESSSLKFLRRYKRIVNNEPLEDENIILDESILDYYINSPCKIFTDDGIDIVTQEYFGVIYSLIDNRACFPIRNYKGELISVKGRTLYNDYLERGIAKYLYDYYCQSENLLFGEWENSEFIKYVDYVIIFESEKSVMKAWQYGYRNCLAISKKSISRKQLLRILALGKKVILAFDSDVTENEIKIECKKFKNLVKVYYIYDWLKILKEKEAPIDRGKDVFKKLLSECLFEYKE